MQRVGEIALVELRATEALCAAMCMQPAAQAWFFRPVVAFDIEDGCVVAGGFDEGAIAGFGQEGVAGGDQVDHGECAEGAPVMHIVALGVGSGRCQPVHAGQSGPVGQRQAHFETAQSDQDQGLVGVQSQAVVDPGALRAAQYADGADRAGVAQLGHGHRGFGAEKGGGAVVGVQHGGAQAVQVGGVGGVGSQDVGPVQGAQCNGGDVESSGGRQGEIGDIRQDQVGGGCAQPVDLPGQPALPVGVEGAIGGEAGVDLYGEGIGHAQAEIGFAVDDG